MRLSKITAYVSMLICSGSLFVSSVLASEDVAPEAQALSIEESGAMYLPSDDAMADINATIVSARDNDRLVLVVMGANWCHDSRGLAARLHTEPLRSLVNEHYETVFVDVGYLEKGKEVISSFGVPVYYATPTVLIIDPMSRQLVNRDNRHMWAEAFSISMDDSVDYFRQMTRTQSRPPIKPGNELQETLSEIDAFEQRQAVRLYAGYAVLGPMLKAYDDGDQPALFDATWMEVRDFRYKVAADIDMLRADALAQAAAGEKDIRLDYPEYAPFSWDTEKQ